MIKAVLVDMDGTLLNEYGKITEHTAEVVRKFQKKGGIFAINTGRGYQTASKLLKEAKIDCDYICLSGAGIYDAEGNCLHSDHMSVEEVALVRKIEKKYDLYTNYLTDIGAFCEGSKERAEAHYLMEAEILANEAGETINDKETALKRYQGILNYIQYDSNIEEIVSKQTVFKMAIMAKDMETLMLAKEEFKSYPEFAVASTFKTNIEVNSSRVDKGLASIKYIESKGLSMDEVMVVGDSENDYAMLVQPFGMRVAMGNADEEIKKICTHETLSNREDGVAYAIEKWTLKPEE